METKPGNKIKVCTVNELALGKSKCIQTNEKEIAVFNINGKYFAIDNVCIHAGAALNEGSVDLEKCQVICSWHGWVYDLATGKCVTHPRQDVFTGAYPVTIENEDIFVVV